MTMTALPPPAPPLLPPKKRTVPILAIILVPCAILIAAAIFVGGRAHKPTPPAVTASTEPVTPGKLAVDRTWRELSEEDRASLCRFWPDAKTYLLGQMTSGISADIRADATAEITKIMNEDC